MKKHSSPMTIKLFEFLKVCLIILSCMLTIGLFVLNLFTTSRVSRDSAELVYFQFFSIQNILILAAILLIVCLLSIYASRWMKTVNNNKVFWILSACYLAAGLFLILNVTTDIRSDAQHVFNAALNVSAGNYEDLQIGSYISRYPHQLGLMLWDMLIQCLFPLPNGFFLCNLCLVIGINYFIYQISHHLFHSNSVSFLTIFLSFAFLPQFFFILFAYGTIPGMFFLVFAFYWIIRFMESKRISFGIGAALCISLSIVLKHNFLIGFISLLIFLILLFLHTGIKKIIAVLMIFLVCAPISTKLISGYFSTMPGAVLDNGTPSVSWITMGTDIDNLDQGPGWYNRYVYTIYIDSGCDAKKASEIAKNDLYKNFEKIKGNPMKALKFFTLKIISTWCDPEYQSVWSGPLQDLDQEIYNPHLKNLYTGGTSYHILNIFFRLISLSIWLFSSLFILRYGKKSIGWEPFYTYLIGGFLFHLIWETKSQYVYTYVFLLIPFSAFALEKVIEYGHRKYSQLSFKK